MCVGYRGDLDCLLYAVDGLRPKHENRQQGDLEAERKNDVN